MTKRWSSVRSDLLKTKRRASKEARELAKREEWCEQAIKDVDEHLLGWTCVDGMDDPMPPTGRKTG